MESPSWVARFTVVKLRAPRAPHFGGGFVQALVSIGGYDLPEPSSYGAVTSTIVDAGRNVSGYVVGAVIRHDVAKVEMSWRYLTVSQWASILSLFASTYYVSVRFFNQTTGNYDTRTMYCSDRTASAWRRDPTTGEVMGWTDCSLSLVEV